MTQLIDIERSFVAHNAETLAKMKLDELKALATESGVKGVSRMRKGELIEALNQSAPSPKATQSAPREEAAASVPVRKPRRAERPTGEAVGRANHDRVTTERPEPIIAINLDELAEAAPIRSGSSRAERVDPDRQARLEELSNAVAEVNTRRERGEYWTRTDRNDRYENRDRAERSAIPGERYSGERQGNDRQVGERRNREERPLNSERTSHQDRYGSHDRSSNVDREPREPRISRDSNEAGVGREDRDGDRNRTDRNGSRLDDRRRQRDRSRDRNDRNDRPERSDRLDRNKRRNDANDEPEISEDDVLVPVAGVLDVLDNYAFVRTSGYLPGPNDVYVSLNQVKRNGLRRGDAIVGAIKQPREGEVSGNARNKFSALVQVDSVNGMTVEEAKQRPEFAKLTPLYPQERLRLETTGGANKLSSRIIDIIAPIGKGQRGLLVSPPKAGKTLMMQQIANSITTNNPEVHLMVVLVDERPEEVTDFQRSVQGEVIASTFDRHASDHTTVAELAIERAKRLVELGQDVVILLDGITRLSRAYNLAAPASGRILSGGVDAAALYPPKKFFGAARNIEGGGSLTIIATALVETGSKMDEVIFEEFKGTGNMELRLSRSLAEKRIYPAINVNASSTRREEILLSKEELAIVYKLRRLLGALDEQQATELLLNKLKETGTNLEFLMQVQKTTPGALIESEIS